MDDRTEEFQMVDNGHNVNEIANEMEAFVTKIAFPRYFGTSNEARAREIIKEEINRVGLNYEIDPFTASEFFMKYINQVPYYAFGACVLVFTMLILLAYNPLETIAYSVALIILAFSIEEIIHAVKYRSMYSRYATLKESENILVAKKAEHPDAADSVNIYLVAHSDSKSEKLDPTKWMTIEYVSVLFGTVLLSVHAIVFSLFAWFDGVFLHPTWLFSYGLILGIIDMLRIATAYYEGDSPGATDDAIGVVVAIAVQQRIATMAFKHVTTVTVISGAEEIGEAGVYNFIKKRKVELQPEKNHFIIIDGLTSWKYHYFTSAGFLFKPFSKLVSSALKAIIQTPNDAIKQFTFSKLWMPPPVNTDHSAVVKLGYPAFVLESGFAGTHTHRDTVDKIDFKATACFVDVLVDLIQEIDRMIEVMKSKTRSIS
ncbi:MAG TPA: M28 family peptidase [Candidatus Lokiarchaeia archaeon]|nr:M28 family peptidase [Candidatus Lokiarchaeia archaeon]